MVIEVWFAPVLQPDEAVLADLDAADLRRMARIGHPERRATFVAAHALMRRVLGRRLGLAPPEVPIDRSCRTCGGEDHGKPFVVGVEPPTVFSVSGTITTVGIAVADTGGLGLDLGNREAGRAWVRREAILKSTGHGLTIDPERVIVTSDEAEPQLVHWPLGPLKDLCLFDLEPSADVIGCVAWRGWCAGRHDVALRRMEYP